jgi:hypothetical protein
LGLPQIIGPDPEINYEDETSKILIETEDIHGFFEKFKSAVSLGFRYELPKT